MWRNLLSERFELTVHHEAREVPVEELVIAKGGPKLKLSAEDPNVPAPWGPPNFENGELKGPGQVVMIYPGANPHGHVFARAQPIAKITSTLSAQLNRPVLDKTGLRGLYDFELEYSTNSGPSAVPGPGAQSSPLTDGPLDLASAVQQQLGLRLVPTRATIDFVVIDRIQKVPAAN